MLGLTFATDSICNTLHVVMMMPVCKKTNTGFCGGSHLDNAHRESKFAKKNATSRNGCKFCRSCPGLCQKCPLNIVILCFKMPSKRGHAKLCNAHALVGCKPSEAQRWRFTPPDLMCVFRWGVPEDDSKEIDFGISQVNLVRINIEKITCHTSSPHACEI